MQNSRNIFLNFSIVSKNEKKKNKLTAAAYLLDY